MRMFYSGLYIVLIFALLVCTVLTRRSGRPIRSSVALLEAALIPPIVGNLLIISFTDRFPALIGCYIYFIGMDLVMFALVNFTNVYCQGIGDGTQKPYVMYVFLAADALQLMLNPFFGHAFNIEPVEVEGAPYYTLMPFWGQTIHRIVDYGVFFCVLLIFFIGLLKTSKVYRSRFSVILITMAVIGLLQTYFIFSKSPIDRSMVGYGVFGLLIFYFAIRYKPLRLLDSMLSSIVSDLSDAFYIFDPAGKCIWANERGCRLAGVTVKDLNYEIITERLKDLFGEKKKSGNHSLKQAVSIGDVMHFFLLEENQVKDESGALNGFYIRIQDITKEEQVLQVKDAQIGQISREAYRDALTGVGSKTAYNKLVNELNREIEDGLTAFAVVMVDLNDLKRINDEHGHKAGDLYLKGACLLICDAFKHSPVFRIGGDEFTVILRGRDFEERMRLAEELRAAFAENAFNEDAEPWQRYSAAVGMAEFASDDNSFELVFKRADQAMYEEKKQFKQTHGSYR